MAEDKSVVKAVEAPPLTPLAIRSPLAPTPKNAPKYKVEIKDSKNKSITLADPSATRALVALMDVHAVNGGAACHWGGPSAFAEIMASIHGIMFQTQGRQWHEAFNFINDAGHTENGIYALRALYGFDNITFESLRDFRSIKSKLTGHGESHLNPEGVLMSNGPLGSALPQAQGLAMADKVAKRDRVTICTVSDGASMEGEAKEAFAAIPGLAGKGKVNPFVMIISDNDTKLSGRITKDSFSMLPTFEAMATLGWEVQKVAQGHNLQEVYQAVERAIDTARSNPNKPVCIWVKTIKGYGVKSTEESSSGGHGFPLNNGEKIIEFVGEIYKGNPPEEFKNWALELRKLWEETEEKKKSKVSTPSAIKKDKVQAGLAKGAVRAAKEGYPVYSISCDVQGSTGISLFQKSLPDRFVEVGIAESNMISTAAGFAKAGFIPIVDTFGQFGVTKGNLPITMAALSQSPVIAIFSHIGFQDAADGASHQASTYFAALSAIPHTTVIACATSDEAENLMYQAIARTGQARTKGEDGENIIFFVGRENYPVTLKEGATYEWGKAQVLSEGSDAVVVASGALVSKAIEAAALLAKEGLNVSVVNSPFINHPDLSTIAPLLAKAKGRLVTVEDHQKVGGMGAMLTHALAESGASFSLKTLGISGEFGQSAYLADELYDQHGMGTKAIVDAVKTLAKK